MYGDDDVSNESKEFLELDVKFNTSEILNLYTVEVDGVSLISSVDDIVVGDTIFLSGVYDSFFTVVDNSGYSNLKLRPVKYANPVDNGSFKCVVKGQSLKFQNRLSVNQRISVDGKLYSVSSVERGTNNVEVDEQPHIDTQAVYRTYNGSQLIGAYHEYSDALKRITDVRAMGLKCHF